MGASKFQLSYGTNSPYWNLQLKICRGVILAKPSEHLLASFVQPSSES